MKKPQIGKILIISGIVLYYLFSIEPVARELLSPLEHPWKPVSPEEHKNVHRVVLLLGGQEADVLRGKAVQQIYFQWEEMKIPEPEIIISGIDPLDRSFNEADFTRQVFKTTGLSDAKIILETHSRTTRESAINLKPVLNHEPFFLATSAYHMQRSIDLFVRQGMHPIAAPADFKLNPQAHPTAFFEFLPGSDNLEKCDIAIHEYAGILFYRLLMR